MPVPRVLLLNPPADRLYQNDNYCSFSSKAGYYAPSIDLLVQSGILGGTSDIRVLDAVATMRDNTSAAKEIEEFAPDAIIFVTGTASWKENFAFIEKVKGNKPITVIASGGNLLFEADRVLQKFTFLDAVLMDYTTDAALRYLGGNRDHPVPNLIYKQNEEILKGPRSGCAEEISYPPPQHDIFPLDSYRLPYARTMPFSRMLTSIGCPYRCSFCVASHVPYRVRNIENVVEELKYLHKHRIHQIYFTDPTFGIDKDRTIELCRAIINLGAPFHWSCNTRVDTVDADRLRVMKEAGCHIVQLGIESGDQDMLNRYSKGTKLETARRAVRLCKEAGLEILAYFIVGLPGETRETASKTIRLAQELEPDYASFDIATPDYGTDLMKIAQEKDWMPKRLDSFDSTAYPVMEIGTLSKEEVWALRNLANRKFYLRPRYILKRLSRIRSLRELQTVTMMCLNLIANMFRRD